MVFEFTTSTGNLRIVVGDGVVTGVSFILYINSSFRGFSVSYSHLFSLLSISIICLSIFLLESFLFFS